MAIEMLYLFATALIKVSILCFYRRLASGAISKTFLYCVQCLIAVFFLHTVIFFFVIVFSYTPIEAYWHIFDVPWRLKNTLKSLDEGAILVSVTTTGTIQDVLVCTLPIFLVWNLQIPRRQRIGLVVLFGAGLM